MILTHKLRSVHDAILVGIGTIIADNPRLTVRHAVGGNPQPIVLDSRLRLPLEAHVLKNHRRPPWIITAEGVDPAREEPLRKAGARILRIATQSHGFLDLSVLLQRLGEMDIISLMVEGGARIITSFLKDQLVNQLVLTMAPVFVGGLRAVNPLQLDLSSRPRLKDVNYELLGEDLVLRAEPAYDDI